MRQTIFFGLVLAFCAFSLYVYTTGTAEADSGPVISELGAEGRLLYQKYNCTSCHQFYGMGGYLGPDLTNVMSAKGKGEPYVRALLTVGTDIMPNFELSEQEIDAFVAFLRYVDQTGNFPEPNVKRTWYGSVIIP